MATLEMRGRAHRTPHALRTHAPAIKSTRLLRALRYLQRGRSISSILLHDRTVSSEQLRFFVFNFLIIFLFGFVRQIKLATRQLLGAR